MPSDRGKPATSEPTGKVGRTGWVKAWLYQPTSTDAVWEQRNTLNNLLNARVLSEDVEASLRETTHVLAAVERALREDTPDE